MSNIFYRYLEVLKISFSTTKFGDEYRKLIAVEETGYDCHIRTYNIFLDTVDLSVGDLISVKVRTLQLYCFLYSEQTSAVFQLNMF